MLESKVPKKYVIHNETIAELYKKSILELPEKSNLPNFYKHCIAHVIISSLHLLSQIVDNSELERSLSNILVFYVDNKIESILIPDFVYKEIGDTVGVTYLCPTLPEQNGTNTQIRSKMAGLGLVPLVDQNETIAFYPGGSMASKEDNNLFSYQTSSKNNALLTKDVISSWVECIKTSFDVLFFRPKKNDPNREITELEYAVNFFIKPFKNILVRFGNSIPPTLQTPMTTASYGFFNNNMDDDNGHDKNTSLNKPVPK